MGRKRARKSLSFSFSFSGLNPFHGLAGLTPWSTRLLHDRGSGYISDPGGFDVRRCFSEFAAGDSGDLAFDYG